MIHCGSRFGQVCATMLRLGMRTSLICRDTSQQGGQQLVALKCYDCLAGACINAGPIILGYVVLICCDRLAGA